MSCWPDCSSQRLEQLDEREAIRARCDSKPSLKSCVFCNVSFENGFDVVFQDNQLIVFKDRWGEDSNQADTVPQVAWSQAPPAHRSKRTHIVCYSLDSVRDLGPQHLPLLSSMSNLAHFLLLQAGVPSSQHHLGFHIPPFSSVPHLHLHALSVPMFTRGKLKYPIRSPARNTQGLHKGWGWFVSDEQAYAIVKSGRKISFGRC